jgi:alpha-L-fucosidase
MKKSAIILPLLMFLLGSTTAQDAAYIEKYNNTIERTEWHRNARFGMFIHWGAYAVAADGEWFKSHQHLTTEEYQKYVDAFVPRNYNPNEWAKLAKEAGMKYAVMTAKHHDGFCLFDSEYTDYKISNNVEGADYTRDYIEAFRSQGLKVGLYYSLIDWHHKDYPYVGNHPLREREGFTKEDYNWGNYIDYMHKQIEELMTNYGQIDILWLDYSFDDYTAEKWGATELIKMIRKHQPDIIINNRLVQNHGVSTDAREFTGYGDFETPEQGIPAKKLIDMYGNDIPWETCLTLNNSWGYRSTDNDWKSPELIIHSLAECVSKNGNLLLNVGPDSQGTIPLESKKTLKAVGEWMKTNGESIYGCRDASFEKPHWGYYTKKGNVLYAHVTNKPIGHINIGSAGKNVEDVFVVNTGDKAFTSESWFGDRGEGNFFINLKSPTHRTYIFPDDRNTVFKVILQED